MSGVLAPWPRRDLDAMSRYLAAVQAAPMLSAAEELRLARRFRDLNDLSAAEMLVVSHLRLVVRVARGYSGYGLELADLVQEGTFGLMRAVKRFDPERGVRLASFALHFIRAHIKEFVLRNWRIVRQATTKAQRKLFFNLRRNKPRLERLRRKELEQIATVLNVSPDDVETMDARLYSSDATIGSYDELRSAGDATLMETALADPGPDPYAVCEALDEAFTQSRAVELGLNTLDARSRDIIQRRWLQDDKVTLAELGEHYGISKERVRQIEAKAFARLRSVVEYPGDRRCERSGLIAEASKSRNARKLHIRASAMAPAGGWGRVPLDHARSRPDLRSQTRSRTIPFRD